MSLDLKGKQLKAFQEALMSAFPRYVDLQMMMEFELNLGLEQIVAPEDMHTVTYKLIVWCRANGMLDELLAGALARVPRNPALRKFALEVSLTSDSPPAGRLEAMVLQDVPFQDVARWRDRMTKAERCVCRVEIPENSGAGTGFLVGPRVVLTNWHVAKLIQKGGIQPHASGVRFDYAAMTNGVAVGGGRFYRFADNYLIDSSPETELDYAFLRVEGEPGNEPIEAERAARGWLTPVHHNFQVGEIPLILQHPLASPLKISAGTITAINSLHQRVTYTANTQRGSSGSPVFTLGWDLIALHHYGEQSGNLGIPLTPIWQRLGEKGLSEELSR